MNMARMLMLGGLAAGLAIAPDAGAQTTAPTGTVNTIPRTAERTDSAVVPAAQLEAGANSYTEGQARSRLEANGFTAITFLRKDDNGFWRATAMRSGATGDVAMDFQGRIAHGAGVATIGTRPAATRATTTAPGTTVPGTTVPSTMVPAGTAPIGTSRAPDGTPGNPPSTAAGRAVDRVEGRPTTPDGAPGNPPGTAAGRAVDRTLGTNPPGAGPVPSR